MKSLPPWDMLKRMKNERLLKCDEMDRKKEKKKRTTTLYKDQGGFTGCVTENYKMVIGKREKDTMY